MGVWVLPNANSLDVIARVRAEIEHIQAELPTGMKASVAFDSTKYIRQRHLRGRADAAETVLIVIVVIFLFLGSLRTVLVPLVAIPVSLIGAVFLMQLFGFTLNLLTLLAVVLAVGLVVDDAIVVVENVERHIRDGKTPLQAALLGARELVGPIIAMTITLAAVYAPIGFQGGLTGALFREFAFTLAGAVFISGVVALTLSPMMSSRAAGGGHHRGLLQRLIDAGFDALKNARLRPLAATRRCARPAVYWCGSC
jgi:multidrug efflux pump